jgi:hypothetical protein
MLASRTGTHVVVPPAHRHSIAFAKILQNPLAFRPNRSDPCGDRGNPAEGDQTKMTTENAATTDNAAAVAAQGATVAPQKPSSKKGASAKKGAPKGHRAAKAGKPKAPPAATPKKTAQAKKAPKAPQKSAKPKAEGPREGTKTAQVVAMLQRKNGATLAEIMKTMGWQKHTVRGFMAGAMKKAGFTVESFKSDKGDRTYRINQ